MVDGSAKAKARELVLDHGLCVLATIGPDGPYLSLMSYLAAENGQTIYLLTKRGSRKHRNLSADPRVSLLIDDREDRGREQRGKVAALSMSGLAHEVADPERAAELLARFVDRHPALKSLAKEPNLAVVAAIPRTWLLLDGPQQSHHWRTDEL